MINLSSLGAIFGFGFGVATCGFAPLALADPITVAESAAPFATQGFSALRLTNALLGDTTPYSFGKFQVSFSGVGDNEGVVKGSSSGNYAPPVTDMAGDTFTGKYLAVGGSGFIDIAFASPQRTLSLLWGSVDMGNRITFLEDGQVVGAVDGADIDAQATGFQGVGGSTYVLLASTLKFNDIHISSDAPAFEIADLRASSADIPVHEPASIALFGAGLLSLAGLRRRI